MILGRVPLWYSNRVAKARETYFQNRDVFWTNLGEGGRFGFEVPNYQMLLLNQQPLQTTPNFSLMNTKYRHYLKKKNNFDNPFYKVLTSKASKRSVATPHLDHFAPLGNYMNNSWAPFGTTFCKSLKTTLVQVCYTFETLCCQNVFCWEAETVVAETYGSNMMELIT